MRFQVSYIPKVFVWIFHYFYSTVLLDESNIFRQNLRLEKKFAMLNTDLNLCEVAVVYSYGRKRIFMAHLFLFRFSLKSDPLSYNKACCNRNRIPSVIYQALLQIYWQFLNFNANAKNREKHFPPLPLTCEYKLI